ncbi:nuclear transport factor 2 family protein [Tsuneonella sp. HG222]
MSDKRIDELVAKVTQLEAELQLHRDVQAIRTLHFTYGYCMDKWLFKEIVDLFARECELRFLNGIWHGREGAKRLYSWTEGAYGPRDGMLAEHVIAQDIVHVAPDRSRAWGRFRALLQVGAHEAYRNNFPPSFSEAFWEAGVHENEYVLEDGVWKIALFNYRLTFQAPYEGGWAKSPSHPIMITPWTGTYPEVPNGPDELRPTPPQWPKNPFIPFHYSHPVTGRSIGEGLGEDSAP